jgi:hypothetical protein
LELDRAFDFDVGGEEVFARDLVGHVMCVLWYWYW